MQRCIKDKKEIKKWLEIPDKVSRKRYGESIRGEIQTDFITATVYFKRNGEDIVKTGFIDYVSKDKEFFCLVPFTRDEGTSYYTLLVDSDVYSITTYKDSSTKKYIN